MARKPRQRYEIVMKYAMNDVPITGQRVVVLGDCNYRGDTKTKTGKNIRKKELTHVKVRFEDKKFVKESELDVFYEFTIAKVSLEKTLEPIEA